MGNVPDSDMVDREALDFWAPNASRWLGQYDADRSRMLEKDAIYQTLLRDLNTEPGAKIADVGCGIGLTSLRLAIEGHIVMATDASPAMVRAARELSVGRFNVRRANATALPFDADVFTGIVCTNVIDFIARPATALGEMWRVARSGAHLVLDMLGPLSPVRDGHKMRFLGHISPLTGILPWEVEYFLNAAGWSVIEQRGSPIRPARDGADTKVSQATSEQWRFVARK